MHDGLASSLSEGIVEIGAMVLSQVVAGERLTAVLVDTLEDLRVGRGRESAHYRMYQCKGPCTHLVASGVSETGEERGELAADGSIGVLLEDDLVEGFGRGDLDVNMGQCSRSSMIAVCRVLSYPSLVAHQSLRGGINLDGGLVCANSQMDRRVKTLWGSYRMEDQQLRNSSGT